MEHTTKTITKEDAKQRHAQTKILCANLRKNKSAMITAMSELCSGKFEIALIQEPPTKRTDGQCLLNALPSGLMALHPVWPAEKDLPLSSAIVIHGKIHAEFRADLSDGDCTVVTVRAAKRKVMIASLYMDIKRNIEEDIEKLANIITAAKGHPLIVHADTNAHSSLWFSPDENERGSKLSDWMMSQDLQCINANKDTPSFSGGVGTSWIDCTLVNQKGGLIAQDWKIEKELTPFSDHRRMSLCLEAKIEQKSKFTTRKYNTKKADWVSFSENLRSAYPNKTSLM